MMSVCVVHDGFTLVAKVTMRGAAELASTINKRVAEEECAQTWLTVSCHDRPGLLADVAVTVAKHGLNLVVRVCGNKCVGTALARRSLLCLWASCCTERITVVRLLQSALARRLLVKPLFPLTGVNLQSYNGGSHSGGCKGSGYMNLLVNAPRSQLDAVRADLQRIPAVTDTRFGEQSDYGADW